MNTEKPSNCLIYVPTSFTKAPHRKAGYTKFELGKPDMQRDVVVEFTLQDDKPDRKEYDSVHNLQKYIRKVLESTNWRLMSDGISYRLGFLNGRLKGVEGEEALCKLAEKMVSKKPVNNNRA